MTRSPAGGQRIAIGGSQNKFIEDKRREEADDKTTVEQDHYDKGSCGRVSGNMTGPMSTRNRDEGLSSAWNLAKSTARQSCHMPSPMSAAKVVCREPHKTWVMQSGRCIFTCTDGRQIECRRDIFLRRVSVCQWPDGRAAASRPTEAPTVALLGLPQEVPLSDRRPSHLAVCVSRGRVK